VDEPLARTDVLAAQTDFLHVDGLGSITDTTTGTGQISPAYRYDSYGNPLVGAAGSGYAFTGREWDPESGLLFYRHRYYDPNTGRFLSEDPLGISSGGINLYEYAGDDPILLVDPFGLTFTCIFSQSTGRLICIEDTTGELIYRYGYSGIGAGLKNPSMQCIPFVGPIPVGDYDIGPAQNRKGSTGPISLPLKPRQGTNTCNRGRFYVHGENSSKPPFTSSEGCPIFAPDVRRRIDLSGGGTFTVIP
jgi:RHS repeat-associated protein